MAELRKRRRTLAVLIAAPALVVSAGAIAILGGFRTPDVAPGAEPPAPPESATPLDLGDLDPLQSRRIGELQAFADWLDAADAAGFVGEVGWPADDDDWDALARAWYAVAADRGLTSTAWAAGSWWPAGYRLAVYRAEGDGHALDAADTQAAILESQPEAGVNVAGLEFGTEEGFSAAEPGEPGVTYYAEPAESYAYLASRGISTVRLPVRWERLQPEPGGALDSAYLELVEGQLDAAHAAGIRVVLDLHNYGEYVTADGREIVDSASLVDVWRRIDRALGDHEAITAYGLMNEPHDLTGDVPSGAALWERVSQETVVGLRDAGVDTTLYVAGYDWSSLARWSSTHRTGWIDDPLDDFRYEAHHYWDGDGSGKYLVDYAVELAATGAAASG